MQIVPMQALRSSVEETALKDYQMEAEYRNVYINQTQRSSYLIFF